MATNFNSISSIINAIKKLMKLQTTGAPTTVPSPMILIGTKTRSGLSPTSIASNIIQRKSEAELCVGPLPSGRVSPDEKMERIRVEEIVKAILENAIITVVIPPGTVLAATGTGPSGPVTVYGSTTKSTTGFGIIQ